MKRSELKRKSWLRSGTKRLARVGRRGKRLRKSGQVFGPLCDFVRELDCCLCGRGGPSDPHHVRSRGAGFMDWLPGGIGNVAPLCRLCHQEHPTDERYIAIAVYYGEEYRRITEAA